MGLPHTLANGPGNIPDATQLMDNFNMALLKDGSVTPTANLPMGSYKLTGLAAGSTSGDSLRYEQLVGVYLPLSGGTMTGTVVFVGVTDGSAAAAGKIGEIITANGSNVSARASNDWTDVASITLTAGRWAIGGIANVNPNGAAINTGNNCNMGVGTGANGDGTGFAIGQTAFNFVPVNGPYFGNSLSPFYVSNSGSVTYYMKILITYSGGTPKFDGRISAIRVG